MHFAKNPPDAASLMTSARSFGNYDLAGALADLIDNSIKAKAKNVRLQCLYNSGDPEIRVVDDGHGMSSNELFQAMRPASTNPRDERSTDDLGRFGWGLKSASFSQCQCLTVYTRMNSIFSGASWDLENLDNWNMAIYSEDEVSSSCSEYILDADGTEIIWNRCDRLSEEKSIDQNQFNELILHARNRLALIFHRYISGEVRGKKLSIELNGIPIPEYDPFYRRHEATMQLECESFNMRGGNKITVQPFILPHYSKMKPADLDKMSGDEGLLKNQGFYVYRNHRLIIFGTWFRLVKHGDLSQLVRISVDIPNSLDEMWKITVDKSDAQLPSLLRTRLKQIVDGLKKRSTKVFRSKGGKVHTSGKVSVWQRYIKNGEIRYEINRQHPLVESMCSDSSDEMQLKFESVLKTIEREFPVMNFGQDVVNNPESINQSVTDIAQLREYLTATLPTLLYDSNGNVGVMVERIKNVEPYCSCWSYVEDYLVQEGWCYEKE